MGTENEPLTNVTMVAFDELLTPPEVPDQDHEQKGSRAAKILKVTLVAGGLVAGAIIGVRQYADVPEDNVSDMYKQVLNVPSNQFLSFARRITGAPEFNSEQNTTLVKAVNDIAEMRGYDIDISLVERLYLQQHPGVNLDGLLPAGLQIIPLPEPYVVFEGHQPFVYTDNMPSAPEVASLTSGPSDTHNEIMQRAFDTVNSRDIWAARRADRVFLTQGWLFASVEGLSEWANSSELNLTDTAVDRTVQQASQLLVAPKN